MFLDYLLNREEVLKERLDIKRKELDTVSFELKENDRFLEVLEKEKTTPFTEFTPQVVSSSEKKKYESLLELDRSLRDKKNLAESEISQIESELKQVVESIKDGKDVLRKEKGLRKDERASIKDKLQRILKEGEYNPAKAQKSLRKYLNEFKV